MKIKQLQLLYQPDADRLLLRISAGNDGEFRFWLTRRLVGLLAEPLGKYLLGLPLHRDGSDPVVSSAENPLRDQAEAAFKHQQALAGLQSKKSFVTPDQPSFPLGEEPLLIAKLGVTPTDRGGVVLSLHSKQDKGLSVELGPSLLHGFCDLLVKCSEQAKWQLELKLVPTGQVSESPSQAFH